jgi:hypothetical protein
MMVSIGLRMIRKTIVSKAKFDIKCASALQRLNCLLFI